MTDRRVTLRHRWQYLYLLMREVATTRAVRMFAGLGALVMGLVLMCAAPLLGSVGEMLPQDEPTRLILVISLLGGIGTYMVKTIYMLVRQRATDAGDRNHPQTDNNAAWQLLTQHTEREERSFENVVRLINETVMEIREIAMQQRALAEMMRGIVDSQQRITESLILLRNPASGGNIL